jgi:hypothetical protein
MALAPYLRNDFVRAGGNPAFGLANHALDDDGRRLDGMNEARGFADEGVAAFGVALGPGLAVFWMRDARVAASAACSTPRLRLPYCFL